jgi:spermidine synthase
MGLSTRVVAALLFGSGFSALVYQTAWQRMFRLTFGASTAASAAVLAVFLGGLGLGGLLLGKRVERSRQPLVYYGNLELGISALAAVSPLLAALVHRLYLGLGGSQALGTGGATALRLLLTLVVIGPAAVLMGGTLPAAARAVVDEADKARRNLALLYSLNTVGAVFGALVGPLLLFGLLGNRLTIWGTVCINALVGVAARAIGRRASQSPEAAKVEPDATEPVPVAAHADMEGRLAYLAAGLVGFVFLGLELVWYRILTPLLGGSSLTFGLILACALAGIGIGGYLFSIRDPRKPVSLQLLGVTLSLEAVGALLAFAWGDQLAFVAAHLRPMLNLGFGYLIAGWVFVAAVVVLPASIVSGYQFPALFALLGRGREQVGVQVGRAYAFNTVGTLTGSLLVGMVLLPSVGAVPLWRGLAVALALLGAACAGYTLLRGAAFKTTLGAFALSALALLLSCTPGPGHLFRHSPIGAGRVLIADESPNGIRAIARRAVTTTAWSEDGVDSTVAIGVEGGLAFLVNGKSDGNVVHDRGTQAFLALLPAALHGKVKTGFVVGLGTGMTCGLLAKVPGVERVEVAELEPSVIEVARRATLANEGALDNPKVEVSIGDGRELLLTSSRQYDVVLSEPSNPYRAGVASLFTHEFYTAAASKLSRGGLFAQWLQGYEVDAATVSVAVHTMRSVFPHVTLWGPQFHDLILIGSFEPQSVDVERLRSTLQDPLFLKWQRRAWSMEGPEALIAHSLAPQGVLEKLFARLPVDVNTDDVNTLEFAFSRSAGRTDYKFMDDLQRTLGPTDYRPGTVGNVDWSRVEELRERGGFKQASEAPAGGSKVRAVVEGCGGRVSRAKALWPASAEPQDEVELWTKGYIAATDGSDEAPRIAERLAQDGFVAEALLINERFSDARGDIPKAVEQLIRAFDALRGAALPLCDANGRALRQARNLARRHPEHVQALLHAVARAPLAVYADESDRRTTMVQLGMQEPRLCVEALGDFRAQPRWVRQDLLFRALCLKGINAPDAAAAEADYLEFLAREPVALVTSSAPGTTDAAASE